MCAWPFRTALGLAARTLAFASQRLPDRTLVGGGSDNTSSMEVNQGLRLYGWGTIMYRRVGITRRVYNLRMCSGPGARIVGLLIFHLESYGVGG